MFRHQIIKGTVQMTILALLEQGGTMYGYEIIQQVHQKTGGEFQWREASLYPALYSLEEQGLIKGEWREGTGKRRRRYYSLSQKGKGVLAAQREEWLKVTGLINRLVSEA